jgi:hypothetical protein
MVNTVAIPDVAFGNLVIFVSHVVILELQPLTLAIGILPATNEIVPLLIVKPPLEVNNFVHVILFVVKTPLFVSVLDVTVLLLFILILLINPVVFKLFKYDAPKTFNDVVFTLSELKLLELNKSRLYIIGI